ncbi:MAG: hypothetical protein R2838_09125 [Caldilineaceae bacterium]
MARGPVGLALARGQLGRRSAGRKRLHLGGRGRAHRRRAQPEGHGQAFLQVHQAGTRLRCTDMLAVAEGALAVVIGQDAGG